MLRSLLLFCLLVISTAVHTQITFNHGWDIWCEYEQNNMQQTSDGGYIFCTDAIPEMDTITNLAWCYLVKLNSLGNPEWIRRFPKSDFATKAYDGNSICQTSDRGYAIATAFYHGDTLSSSGEAMWIYVIKTDSAGNYLWSATYPGSSQSKPNCIHETTDHGLIICGSTVDPAQSNGTFPYLLRLDSMGTIQWGQYYDDGVIGTLGGFSTVDQCPDGGFISTGYRSDGYGLVLKTDATGTITWSGCPTTGQYCYCNDIIPLASGGYLFCGAEGTSSILIRYDDAGAVVWEKKYYVPANTGDVAYSVVPTWDGFTVAIMQINTTYSGRLMHTDTSGTPMWSVKYPDTAPFMPIDLEHTADNGYAFMSAYYGNSTVTGWFVQLLKTDSAGHIGCNYLSIADSALSAQTTSPVTLIAHPAAAQAVLMPVLSNPTVADTDYCPGTEGFVENNSTVLMQVYPNPATAEFSITVSGLPPGEADLNLYNVLGEVIASQSKFCISGALSFEVDAEVLGDGIYMAELVVGGIRLETRSVIIEH